MSRSCSDATGDDRVLSDGWSETACCRGGRRRACWVEKGCWPRSTISMLCCPPVIIYLFVYFNLNLHAVRLVTWTVSNHMIAVPCGRNAWVTTLCYAALGHVVYQQHILCFFFVEKIIPVCPWLGKHMSAHHLRKFSSWKWCPKDWDSDSHPVGASPNVAVAWASQIL